MVKNAQVTPFTDAIIAMSQEDAEKAIFSGEWFTWVCEMVQRIVQEVSSMRDETEMKSKKSALLRKVAQMPNNKKWNVFLALSTLSGNNEDQRNNGRISKKRYEKFLEESENDESLQINVWKVYQNLGNIELTLWNTELAEDYWRKIPEETWEIFYKACYSHGKLHFNKGNSEMCDEHWDKIPETSTMYALVCLHRGNKAFENWDFETAKSEYLKIKSLEKKSDNIFKEARYKLWILAFREDAWEGVVEYMLQTEDFWERNFVLGYSYYVLDRYDEAIPLLESVEAKENSPTFQDAVYCLTHIFYVKWETSDDEAAKKAIEYWKTFLEIYEANKEENWENNEGNNEQVISIECFYHVQLILGHLQDSKEHLEMVTQEAGIELYGRAQRLLWYLEWFEDWGNKS